MYLNTVVLASLLGLAAAASSDSSSDVTSLVAQLPTCSVSCLDQGATSAGCGTSDYSCQCEKQEAITANATSCLASSCALSNITSKRPAYLALHTPKPIRLSTIADYVPSHPIRCLEDLRRRRRQQHVY